MSLILLDGDMAMLPIPVEGRFMKKSGRSRLLLSAVGILIVLLGLRGMALGVAGKTTQANVTEVKRAVGDQSDRMDYNYTIRYRFSLNGKEYTGSFTRKKVYNAATLPSIGAPVTVRYLSCAPVINGGSDTGLLTGLVLAAFGVLLFGIGVRRSTTAVSSGPEGATCAEPQS